MANHKPKPSIRFFMQAKELGEVKIILSYDSRRYYGKTEIEIERADFDNYLTSKGTPKQIGRKVIIPKILYSYPITEAFRAIREEVLTIALDYINSGEEINKETAHEIIFEGVRKGWERMLYEASTWLINTAIAEFQPDELESLYNELGSNIMVNPRGYHTQEERKKIIDCIERHQREKGGEQ